MKSHNSQSPVRLSEDLIRLLDHAGGKPIMVQEIIEILHGRGLNVLVLLFALPFCVPIPLPGISTPFGMAIMFLGLRISLRKHPWLPKKLLQRQIPFSTLANIIRVALKIATRLEKVIHPRLKVFTRWNTLVALNGLIIAASAFLLMLPIPLPFTNTLPAFAIVLTAAGMLEEDGAIIVTGYLMAGISWIYVVSLFFVGAAGVNFLRRV